MSRPSRQQQLDHAAEVTKEKIAAEKRKLATIASAQRAEQRKVRDQRRYQVGTLCDEAGLVALEDALLKELLALLGQVVQQADPHATVAAACAPLLVCQAGPWMAPPLLRRVSARWAERAHSSLGVSLTGNRDNGPTSQEV